MAVVGTALLVWQGVTVGVGRADPGLLTPQEQAYVQDLGPVPLCVDPDWPPFERINGQGEYEGIAADLLRLISERSGVLFTLVPTHDWEASIEASKSGRCKVLGFLNQTPARESWLLFTAPLFSDANVFITREEHFFIADPADLGNETIVFPVGTAMEERVRRDYPNLVIRNCASEMEAMHQVSERKADMTLRSLIVAAWTIKTEGLFNLKIAGKLPDYANLLRCGVSRDLPELRDILDKAIRTITPQERERIVNRHVSINVQTGMDFGLIVKIVAVFVVAAGVGVAWNMRLKKLYAELELRSQTDTLTRLPNRTRIDALLRQEVERAGRYDRSFAIILFDVDHFKAVNDVHGHLMGDKVLIRLARAAKAAVRASDTVGRWGGEEFLVLCPETEADAAAHLADRLRLAVKAQIYETGTVVTISAGVAAFVAGDSADTLLTRADTALYRAKSAGRDRAASA
ncbi:diguanylate cyclase [Solidesulfovibrio sp.]